MIILSIAVVFCLSNGFGNKISDTLLIKSHLEKITKTDKYRNYENVEALNGVAEYIYDNFEHNSDTVHFQEYQVNGKTYKNVICSFGDSLVAKTIVIGAHYDVCGNQEGADDNASGIVALLELARLLKGRVLNYRIELVAYTLEEPPFFGTKNMGSYIHAKSLRDSNIDVYGMICLEMIGYFDETENSQNYPYPGLSALYGSKGDFIALIGKSEKGRFAREFCEKFKKYKLIKTEIFDGPVSSPNIGLSDHINYWNLGFSALMITDTAFMRNKNYHTKKDTMEKLDVVKMANVIDSIIRTLTYLK